MPQHRNGKERVFDEEKEVGIVEMIMINCFFFSSLVRNDRMAVAMNFDDDDDLMIEMTSGPRYSRLTSM